MEPFLGEIKLYPYSRIPTGWHICDGSILQVAQYQALYSLLQNTYGGTAPTTFALPDLRGRTAMHCVSGNPVTKPGGQGYAAGEETVTLTLAQTPVHTHAFNATNSSGTAIAIMNNFPAAPIPPANPPANAPQGLLYGLPQQQSQVVTIATQSIAEQGGGQPHTNLQPYLALVYCIAVQGIYPPHQ